MTVERATAQTNRSYPLPTLEQVNANVMTYNLGTMEITCTLSPSNSNRAPNKRSVSKQALGFGRAFSFALSKAKKAKAKRIKQHTMSTQKLRKPTRSPKLDIRIINNTHQRKVAPPSPPKPFFKQIGTLLSKGAANFKNWLKRGGLVSKILKLLVIAAIPAIITLSILYAGPILFFGLAANLFGLLATFGSKVSSISNGINCAQNLGNAIGSYCSSEESQPVDSEK